ncbi:hypothetical protein MXD59_22865 [Frankia sp. Ag45/Mut15]|uniref:Uncharacterized protein n=1 Tax=Frankia umida TaxID=573489 RepID=A0ABT0K468_9ACTN|nr:hypothetical protein [Frankia umida]MCK9878569.1 hypothetical protein [Frankia umida]
MSLAGARPRGPKAELENKSQLALLHHLHDLNQPYRVSYEMVVRKVWADDGDARVRRSRARDLSRQFRGDKEIDWHVVECYLELLFPDDHEERGAQLAHAHPLFVAAFGPEAADEADPGEDAAAEPSPEYVAELERQLAESRMRASLATALLVIVRSENATLRGRSVSFNWFDTAATTGDRALADRTSGNRAALGDRATPGGQPAPDRQPAPGGRTASGGHPPGDGAPHDPVTAPIARPPTRRNAHRHRRSPTVAPRPTPVSVSGRLYPSAAPTLAAAVAAAAAAARSTSAATNATSSTSVAGAFSTAAGRSTAAARGSGDASPAGPSASARTTSGRGAGVQPDGLSAPGIQSVGIPATGNRVSGNRGAASEPDILAAGPTRRRRGR